MIVFGDWIKRGKGKTNQVMERVKFTWKSMDDRFRSCCCCHKNKTLFIHNLKVMNFSYQLILVLLIMACGLFLNEDKVFVITSQMMRDTMLLYYRKLCLFRSVEYDRYTILILLDSFFHIYFYSLF